jgi:hypothetical protein
MEKIWKVVQEFPRYEVSNSGEIRIIAKNKIISQRTSKDGYKKLNLYDGKLHTRSTHRVVLEAFKEKPKIKGIQCNHIDGNKLNNYADNLEWCTGSENTKHAYLMGLCNHQKTGKRKKLSNEDVTRILKLLRFRVKQSIIAKHFKISQPYVSEIKRGKKRKNIG